jgi:hypothetical protein
MLQFVSQLPRSRAAVLSLLNAFLINRHTRGHILDTLPIWWRGCQCTPGRFNRLAFMKWFVGHYPETPFPFLIRN